MTFTDRAMLVGLVAVAIPVVVHFVGRRAPRVVLLPTARFAEGAHAGSRNRTLLRRIALLLARVAVVALLVLALAGPRLGSEPQSPSPLEGEGPGVRGAAASPPHPASPPSPTRGEGSIAPAPIKVLVVDAADEKDLKVRSADMVAAALAGDTLRPKKVWRKTRVGTEKVDAFGTDVVFWISPSYAEVDPNADLAFDVSLWACVWVPAAPDLATGAAPKASLVEETPGGMTIDPDGYTSDLLVAFEAGTSGDLGAPVFCRRVLIDGPVDLRFRDGRPAICESRYLHGMVAYERRYPHHEKAYADTCFLRLAFGPAPAWGDLGNRPEFVVLINSLAEALGPKPDAPAPPTAQPVDPIKINLPPPPTGTDLAIWCVLAMAAMLIVEGFLAAPRRA
jgi:hypothetical protein